MGHGGTLDPMATGVLILGVGNGTKRLGNFLECTKSYETVVLFGAATDTYDGEGKVVARAAYSHVTREKVEEALNRFRGDIMQKPPVFSALRIQGKRLYEYARAGEEVPVEIQERPVTVDELEVLEWHEGGAHQWHWPTTEAATEEKRVAKKVLKLGERPGMRDDGDATDEEEGGVKRKRDDDETVGGAVTDAGVAEKKVKVEQDEAAVSGALPKVVSTPEPASIAEDASATADASAKAKPCPAPAVRLRMTVTSGFYVRSLAHDLGAAVGSLGIMTSLVRTRQGDFALDRDPPNVLEYHDLAKGEEVWGPKVEAMLKQWEAGAEGRAEERRRKEVEGGKVQRRREGGDWQGAPRRNGGQPQKRRRNSSSEED